MKSLMIAVLTAVVLGGCAVHAGIGPHGASAGARVYLFDKDRGQHYYHDHHGNRSYMEKGWKQ
jgi:hypothetical protein